MLRAILVGRGSRGARLTGRQAQESDPTFATAAGSGIDALRRELDDRRGYKRRLSNRRGRPERMHVADGMPPHRPEQQRLSEVKGRQAHVNIGGSAVGGSIRDRPFASCAVQVIFDVAGHGRSP